MRIGLIDVDSHNFPNLALMKISGYHKDKGDDVEWWNGLMHYDRVYMSKVFDDTYSTDMNFCINADEVIKGGTGYDLQNELPYEIEHHYPDYELYSGGGATEHTDFSQGVVSEIVRSVSSAKKKEKLTQLPILTSFGEDRRKSCSWIQTLPQVRNARNILTV